MFCICVKSCFAFFLLSTSFSSVTLNWFYVSVVEFYLTFDWVYVTEIRNLMGSKGFMTLSIITMLIKLVIRTMS